MHSSQLLKQDGMSNEWNNRAHLSIYGHMEANEERLAPEEITDNPAWIMTLSRNDDEANRVREDAGSYLFFFSSRKQQHHERGQKDDDNKMINC